MDELPIWVKLRVCGHEVMVRMVIIQSTVLVVAGQAVRYSVCVTIHMLDGEVKAGEVLPPSSLSARQIRLGLEIFKTLVVCYYDESSP